MSILENEQEFLAEKIESSYRLAKETASQCSDEIEKKGVRKLAHKWLEAKRPLINLLGGQTRVEKIVESELELEDARKIVQEFMNKLMRGQFTYKRADYSMQLLKFKDSDFIYDLNCVLQSSEGVKALQENIVTDEIAEHMRFRRLCSNIGVDPQRQKGAKFSKFFLTVFKAGLEKFNLLKDEDAIRELDIISQDFSKLINTMKTAKRRQTVVLSCDLDDFLTMSMGTSWESCHRLGKMYGMGAIAYALSPNVLVAYVKADNHEYEKKWRQVIYCDPATGFAIGSRQYPSANTVASSGARNIWQECYSLATTGVIDGCNFKFSKSSRGLRQYLTKSNGFAYIDILEFSPSSENISGHVWSTWVNGVEKTVIDCCPREIVCLTCGGMHHNVRSHRFTCGECPREGQQKCRECGRYHAEETCTYIEMAGGYVCSRCVQNEYVYCPICRRWERDYNTMMVRGERICEDCASVHYYRCTECGEWHEQQGYNWTIFLGRGRNRRLCEDCASAVQICQCAHCEAVYYASEIITTHDGKKVCRGCGHRYYTQCSSCDQYHLRPTVHLVENEEDETVRMCQSCRNEQGVTGRPLPTAVAGSEGRGCPPSEAKLRARFYPSMLHLGA